MTKFRTTSEEDKILLWCYENLDYIQISEFYGSLKVSDIELLDEDNAGEILCKLLATIVVRGIRAELRKRKVHPKRINQASLKDDIFQQVRNEIQETLLLHAPGNWSDEQLEAIEEEVTQHTRAALDKLTDEELRSPKALRLHIARATADAKRLIHEQVQG